MERPIEGGDAGEGDTALRILHEEPPEHPELVGDAGEHHRVVDVADDDAAASLGGNVNFPPRWNGWVGLEGEVDRVPWPLDIGQNLGTQVNPEVAIAIGNDPRLRSAEPGKDRRSRHDAPGDAAADVAPLGTQ